MAGGKCKKEVGGGGDNFGFSECNKHTKQKKALVSWQEVSARKRLGGGGGGGGEGHSSTHLEGKHYQISDYGEEREGRWGGRHLSTHVEGKHFQIVYIIISLWLSQFYHQRLFLSLVLDKKAKDISQIGTGHIVQLMETWHVVCVTVVCLVDCGMLSYSEWRVDVGERLALSTSRSHVSQQSSR